MYNFYVYEISLIVNILMKTLIIVEASELITALILSHVESNYIQMD